uniref:Uncharacterized protein n=1 Tax=Romanomermis culicivorax TaxID=13658 RepID=A0A915HN54_ROMCU
MMATLFPRIQVHLRRSMVEFQDALDGELRQWKNCSRISSGNMEAQISLFGKDQNAVEILIRAPAPYRRENDDTAASCCFYFGEDLLAVVEQTCAEVAPGLPLERHFLSPRDLRDGKFQPTVYTPADVMEMQ